MREQLAESFSRRFESRPVCGARAPGRVNLIGEHTDYNEGWVLPFAVDQAIWIVAAPRSDQRVRVWSEDLQESAEFDARSPRRQGGWIDYVQAAAWALQRAGYPQKGCDLAIASQLPRERGLSSSAALGVASAAVLAASHGVELAPRAWAEAAHEGEREFVGVGCGIMDQFASALSKAGSALLIDCRSREVQPVPVPARDVTFLVADSGVGRALGNAESGYQRRVAECRAALEAVRQANAVRPEVRALRDLSSADLPTLEEVLPPPLFRRARHVIREGERVRTTSALLEAATRGEPGALEGVGERLRDGQTSLRNDFEASTPELDALCEIADGQPGVYGSRITGAGFGGCTLHMLATGAAERLQRILTREFERRFARRPEILEVRPSEGASLLAGF